MTKPRTVAAITTSRADFSHLVWPLRAIDAHEDLSLRLVETGAHLSPEFGATGHEIRAAGLDVEASLECLISSDTDVGMAKTIGVAILSLADVLDRLRPDIVLLVADRYEMLAPAAVALALRIPIAHIEGGEISEGAIDDAVRNALTKMAHVHFTPHDQARQRVIAMGEEPWRVHVSGAPSLDRLRHAQVPQRAELAARLDVDLTGPLVVVAMHPVTLMKDTVADGRVLLEALERVDARIVFSFPNADAGSRTLIELTRAFCAARSNAHVFVNLGAGDFFGLLGCADALVGNSSSGIMETASFALPTVNVGERQRGRLRAANVVDVPARADEIAAAVGRTLEPGFRAALRSIANPYGDGRAGERIAAALAALPSRDRLLFKRAPTLYDAPAGPAFRPAGDPDR